MLTYDQLKTKIQSRITKTATNNANTLLAKVFVKKIKESWNKSIDTESVMQQFIDQGLAEELTIYSFKKPNDTVSIIVYNEFITNKYLWHELALNDKKYELIKNVGQIFPIPYEKLHKSYIKTKDNKLFLEFVFCTVQEYKANIIDVSNLQISLINKTLTYTDEEADAIGEFLADLIPLLEEIESQE